MSNNNNNNNNRKPYTIGISGGTGAGKSTLARKLYEALGGGRNATYLVHDSYYRDQSHKPVEERAATNFDHPDALETNLLIQHVRDLKMGKIVKIPTYDFTSHTRVESEKAVQLAGPRPILIIEGILILCDPALVDEMDLKVFVDAAPDIRFIRRMERDCAERGRTMANVIEQYHKTVRPMHEQFVEPSKYVADLIVHSSAAAEPGSPHRLDVACGVLTNHLRVIAGLKERDEEVANSVEDALAQMKVSENAASSRDT